nr:MAG TPA: hypothetical protein [Caudoviricetes sp.]
MSVIFSSFKYFFIFLFYKKIFNSFIKTSSSIPSPVPGLW